MSALIVILCLSWSNVSAVFKQNMLEDSSARAFAEGGINIFEDNRSALSFDTSYVAQTIMRDTLVFYSVLPSFDIGLDVIFLPAFKEWNDDGILNTRWPLNARVLIDYTERYGNDLKLKTRAFFGAEYIAEYQNDFYSGVAQFVGLRLNPKLVWNAEIQLADIGFDTNGLASLLSRFENTLSYRFGMTETSIAYLLSLDIQNPAVRIGYTIKLGSRFLLSSKLDLYAGASFNPNDKGWSVSTGATFNDIRIFKGNSAFSIAVVYRPVAGFSFVLSVDWKPIKLKPL